MKKRILLMLVLVVFVLTGCQLSGKEDNAEKNSDIVFQDSGYDKFPVKAQVDFFAMDTVMTFTVFTKDKKQAEKTLNAAKAEIKRLEDTLSTNVASSQIAKINENGKGELGADGQYLMKRSQEVYNNTQGAFNIAVYPIVKAWGFTTNRFQVPDQKELDRLLLVSKMSLLDYSQTSGKLSFKDKDMGIDFGGIAKGYAGEQLMKVYKENGITAGMINLGGNVQVLNSKPDGDSYRIGIQDPDQAEEIVGVVAVNNEAVITSGPYQRFFEKDGKKYHHIIDPNTGYPAESGLTSVSIISKDGTLADALATSLFVMGKEKAVAYWHEHQNEFQMILIDSSGDIYLTSGIEERFGPKGTRTVQVIS